MKQRIFENSWKFQDKGSSGIGLYIMKEAIESNDDFVYAKDNKLRWYNIILGIFIILEQPWCYYE